ncbi:nitroreductase [Pseudonocardia dioxanivorans CB1190]|uniref:Nitroreductase n=2 Tax=Pseudonocardia dioxanivorans TaxID=240495 RepID=F4CJ06_PSEUX|nr:nitroreductase [Pseudonocardia dioxanivorans CB1190]
MNHSPAVAERPADTGGRSVTDTLMTRRSVRAYLDRPVSREVVAEILRLAARSASNSNTQPWHVHVLTGLAKRRLTDDLWEALDRGGQVATDYAYQPAEWCEHLAGRRKEFGENLYRTVLGIDPDDHRARHRHHRRNYDFFGAPVGLVLTVDRHSLGGGLVDAGAFLQAVVLLARERGMDTCPQASFLDFHPILRRHLRIPEHHSAVCGIAMGFADREHRLDRLRTGRAPVESFTTFHD